MVDRRLGRGLDFFLSGTPKQSPPAAVPQAGPKDPIPKEDAPQASTEDGSEVLLLPVGQLDVSPYQPRRHVDPAELQELAESIRASGILQPILARRKGERFEIIAGERRWRAAQLAGQDQVPVLVRPLNDQESAVASLVENVQREDLNAMEKAEAFRALMNTLGTTQEGVAKQVGFERSTVSNFLRLLDLPTAVQAHVSRGTLSMGHARCLLALPDNDSMVRCADQCIREAWSVRRLEAEVKSLQAAATGAPAAKTSARARPVWLNELEETLVDSLGAPVAIKYGRKRSQIVIECAGRDELERIYQRLTKSE
jgi:ParB family chromosome partitioning protein